MRGTVNGVPCQDMYCTIHPVTLEYLLEYLLEHAGPVYPLHELYPQVNVCSPSDDPCLTHIDQLVYLIQVSIRAVQRMNTFKWCRKVK